jgi:2-isopropylmalate synthase
MIPALRTPLRAFFLLGLRHLQPYMARIQLYDTTLRDGSQGEGVNFSLQDKLMIAKNWTIWDLTTSKAGIHCPIRKTKNSFSELLTWTWKAREDHSLRDDSSQRRRRKRRYRNAGADLSKAPVITIVGKTWDLHVTEVLRVSLEENLAMISDSIAYAKSEGREVIYDAEHCFDGWKANPDYAVQTWKAAAEAGADMI